MSEDRKPTSPSPPPLAPTQATAGPCLSTNLSGQPAGAPGPLPEQFGRYRVVRQLGRGGMGSVYLAHDPQLDRAVAHKVPHFTANDSQLRERFHREAHAAAALEHPNICPVYEAGEVNGVHYLAMAYIDGKPLSALIQPGKGLPQRPVAAIVRKLAKALQEAHAKGVIHRDLKPSNVMINQRNEPVLMDFGLARCLNTEDVRLTKEGSLLGTPAYMPPEQVSGQVEAMGPACDIYSLGVLLYELLTGQLPFEGPMPALLAQILTQPPGPPSNHRRDLDPPLEAVCLKALAKKPEDRYRTMGELAAALTDYLRGGGPPAAGAALSQEFVPDQPTARPRAAAVTAAALPAATQAAPPEPPFALPADRGPAGPPPNAPPRRNDARPVKAWNSSNPLAVVLLSGGALAALLFACVCGGFFFMPERGPTPGGPAGQPVPPFAGLPEGGPTAGPVQPGAGGLAGTYQRRYDDAAMGLGKNDSITFYADGRFEERGFLAAALGSQILPDGKVVFFSPQAGGNGTYRYTGSRLELTYTAQTYTPAQGPQTVDMNAGPVPGDPSALLINTRYTFVRAR